MRAISAAGAVKGVSRGVAVVPVAMFVWPFAGALSDAETSSALRIEISGTPQRVHGSDGREHIEYDLHHERVPRRGHAQVARGAS
jgi:hypothetical protein